MNSHGIFLYLFIDGHLGCLHVFAIVSNAAMTMGVQISFQVGILFPSGKYPQVELLDHITSIFNFLRTLLLPSLVVLYSP